MGVMDNLQPIATIIASIVAAGAAIKFGSIQAEIAAQQVAIAKQQAETAAAVRKIAESQRDIAFDKLKADLFDRRFQIFRAALELIRNINVLEEADPRSRELRDTISEAPFFFPAEEHRIFATIRRRAYDYYNETDKMVKATDATEKSIAKQDAEEALVELYNISSELPTKMEKELAFKQLVDSAE